MPHRHLPTDSRPNGVFGLWCGHVCILVGPRSVSVLPIGLVLQHHHRRTLYRLHCGLLFVANGPIRVLVVSLGYLFGLVGSIGLCQLPPWQLFQQQCANRLFPMCGGVVQWGAGLWTTGSVFMHCVLPWYLYQRCWRVCVHAVPGRNLPIEYQCNHVRVVSQ